MITLDTNILVRFLVADDAAQHAKTVALLRRGPEQHDMFFVGDIVMAELTWVLTAAYGFERPQIAEALRALLDAEYLVFESSDRCRRALHRFVHGRAGFADYMIEERGREAGCVSLATFDHAMHGDPGVFLP